MNLNNPIIKNDILSEKISKMPKQKNNGALAKSSLMINPTNEKHLDKLSSLQADIAVINLEDGIAESKKEEALFLCAKALSSLESSTAAISIRTNPIDSVFFQKEIELINAIRPDAVRIPKIRNKEEILRLEDIIDDRIDIHLSIETKEAFANIATLKTSKRVTTLFLGAIDLLEDLGLGTGLIDNFSDSFKYIMCKFLVDSKTVGCMPFSFIYQDYKNMDVFKKWLNIEAELGFEAKACISPAQVQIVNDFFVPSPRSIEDALYIKKLFEKNEALGIGGFEDQKFGFIDAPIYKNAILTLKKCGKFL